MRWRMFSSAVRLPRVCAGATCGRGLRIRNSMRSGVAVPWLAWALGRSTHAERYAILACEVEPEHGLAEIVRSFVLAGHLPDWAFRRQPR